MRADVAAVLKGADPVGWKPVRVEYGADAFEVRVPPDCRLLEMREVPPHPRPGEALRASIAEPIGCPPLPEIIRDKGKPAGALAVCIATSDITRPVPYKGEGGLLRPLLGTLHAAGIRPEQITLLVGTGTHRPSTAAEKGAMFGEEVVGRYRIEDHDCDDDAALVEVGRTAGGTPVRINRHFVRADLRIATALVESHFMAGASGGRKAVCPALVSRQTIEKFHSADILDSPLAANLVLEGNPCHEESLQIARMAGVDFIVNTVLNRRLELIAAFSGHLEAAHQQAVALLRSLVAIPVDEESEVVLTHGGFVGINHYQAAKAAVNALPAVRQDGLLILAACERDQDPVGPLTYRSLLHLLTLQGPEGYLATLRQPGWRFTKDQWEPQMWGKVLAKVGEAGLVYCSATLTPEDYRIVPGTPGLDFLPEAMAANPARAAQAMTQNAILWALHHPRWAGRRPRMAFIPEGPYAVPVLQ